MLLVLFEVFVSKIEVQPIQSISKSCNAVRKKQKHPQHSERNEVEVNTDETYYYLRNFRLM